MGGIEEVKFDAAERDFYASLLQECRTTYDTFVAQAQVGAGNLKMGWGVWG